MMLARFRPKHTLRTVLKELEAGLSEGSIVLSRSTNTDPAVAARDWSVLCPRLAPPAYVGVVGATSVVLISVVGILASRRLPLDASTPPAPAWPFIAVILCLAASLLLSWAVLMLLPRFFFHKAPMVLHPVAALRSLHSLRNAGIISMKTSAEEALRDFAAALYAESHLITIMGSSYWVWVLLGQPSDAGRILRSKISSGTVRVRFLLAHPMVAELRGYEQGRASGEVTGEILESLCMLRQWRVPPENVRLFRGEPSLFVIETSRQMLLSPFCYGALASPSLYFIVESGEERLDALYHGVDRWLLGAWHSPTSTHVSDFEETLRELEANRQAYAELAREVLSGRQR